MVRTYGRCPEGVEMRNLITCLVVSVLSGVAVGDILTVDDDGKADFNNIQAAVDAASDGDEIVVMPGTYTATQNGHVVNMLGKAVTLRSSDPSDPDVVTATIIDGENTRRGLACFNNEISVTIIDGFTIINGYSSIDFDYGDLWDVSSWEDGLGGGMVNYESSPTIQNCVFQGNDAFGKGGGVYNYGSSPTFTSCTFENNYAGYKGGGMALHDWKWGTDNIATLTNCNFKSNTSNTYGGGISSNQGRLTLIHCTLSHNTAESRGGGLYVGPYAQLIVINNCTITSNTAITEGGGGVSTGGSVGCNFLDTTICGNIPNQINGIWNDEGGNTVATICPVAGACCTNDNCLVSEQENCLAFFGEWQGEGTTCEDNPCPTSCFGDITGDGQVNVSDLLAIIAVWGVCP